MIYLTLQHILLIRLELAFSNSAYSPSDRILTIWRCFHLTCVILALVFFVLRTVYTSCLVELQSTIEPFPWPVHGCRGGAKYWIVYGLFLLLGVSVIIGGNCVLVYMYVLCMHVFDRFVFGLQRLQPIKW